LGRATTRAASIPWNYLATAATAGRDDSLEHDGARGGNCGTRLPVLCDDASPPSAVLILTYPSFKTSSSQSQSLITPLVLGLVASSLVVLLVRGYPITYHVFTFTFYHFSPLSSVYARLRVSSPPHREMKIPAATTTHDRNRYSYIVLWHKKHFLRFVLCIFRAPNYKDNAI
jgi:hypothetical protein